MALPVILSFTQAKNDYIKAQGKSGHSKTAVNINNRGHSKTAVNINNRGNISYCYTSNNRYVLLKSYTQNPYIMHSVIAASP